MMAAFFIGVLVGVLVRPTAEMIENSVEERYKKNDPCNFD